MRFEQIIANNEDHSATSLVQKLNTNNTSIKDIVDVHFNATIPIATTSLFDKILFVFDILTSTSAFTLFVIYTSCSRQT